MLDLFFDSSAIKTVVAFCEWILDMQCCYMFSLRNGLGTVNIYLKIKPGVRVLSLASIEKERKENIGGCLSRQMVLMSER